MGKSRNLIFEMLFYGVYCVDWNKKNVFFTKKCIFFTIFDDFVTNCIGNQSLFLVKNTYFKKNIKFLSKQNWVENHFQKHHILVHLQVTRELRDLNFDSNCCFQPIPQSVEQSKTNWEGWCNFFPLGQGSDFGFCWHPVVSFQEAGKRIGKMLTSVSLKQCSVSNGPFTWIMLNLNLPRSVTWRKWRV